MRFRVIGMVSLRVTNVDIINVCPKVILTKVINFHEINTDHVSQSSKLLLPQPRLNLSFGVEKNMEIGIS